MPFTTCTRINDSKMANTEPLFSTFFRLLGYAEQPFCYRGPSAPLPPREQHPKIRNFLTPLLIGIFCSLTATVSHAETKGLQDVYHSLRITLPLNLRQTLTDSQTTTNIALAEAPYQVQFSVQSQGDIDTHMLSTWDTTLYAKLNLLTEDKRSPRKTVAEAQAIIQSLAETEQQLLKYQTATLLYFRALTAQEADKHTDRILAIVTKQQAWLKNQVSIGRSKPSSLSSNQLTINKLQLQQAQYQRQKREAMFQLSSLTGINPYVSLAVPTKSIPATPSESKLYQRPDIRKQQWRIRALDAEIAALSWTPWPQLDVFGSVTPQDQDGKIGFAAKWPLFDIEERVLTEELRRSRHKLETLQLQENYRTAVGELWAQADTIRSLEYEYNLAKTTVSAAESQYQHYKTEFNQNLVTMLDVLQTLNSLHEAQLDLSRRQIAVQEAIALLPITLWGEIPE